MKYWISGWWWLNHLEKYEFVNGQDDIPYIMENIKCSKPPTSWICIVNVLRIFIYIIIYIDIDIYPPTPAVSRGSASEEALLATRCQKGRRVCAERKPAPGGHEQGGSWQWRNAGKLGPKRCRTKAGSRRTRAGWQLAVQKRRKSQGLELVSSRFRKWRLAFWDTGRGPNPSFTAMVF